LVGGGIDSFEKAKQARAAGADIIVIGNALEKNIHLLEELRGLTG
jgi:heptaprenylglyceryl phosphate synthase